MKEIDLNADLGEESPHEAELFALVTSANISCGAHAGGGRFLREAIQRASAHGVAIGAHPSYPDRENFGRVSLLDSFDHDELVESLTDQLLEFHQILDEEGAAIHHVKAHGALYNDALIHNKAADAILAAVAQVEAKRGIGQVPVMTMAGCLADRALAQGRQVIFEFFADRAYSPEGKLVPRSQSGAVLHDGDRIAARVLTFLETGGVETTAGDVIPVMAESICVHGDNPEALAIAQKLHANLLQAGVSVRSV